MLPRQHSSAKLPSHLPPCSACICDVLYSIKGSGFVLLSTAIATTFRLGADKQASVSIRLPDPIYHRGQVTLTDNECGRNLYDAFQVKTLSSVTVTDLCRPLISTFVQPVSRVQILIHILANIGKSVSRLSSERSRRGRLVNLSIKPPAAIVSTFSWHRGHT